MLLALKRCRRRKRYSQAAAEFDFDSMNNLLALHRELVAATWEPGEYHHFQITDPKPRKISAAPFRDRVVHHAIVNVLEPIFDKRFIHDSYACRRGKGTHRGILRAQQFLRRYQWTLKTDIVRFFPTIDHELLLLLLTRVIRDADMIGLITKVIDSGRGILDSEAPRFVFPGDDLFSQLRPRGLPIGNLTSQFFANLYLDPLDHFCTEALRAPFVRYVDDFALFADDADVLAACRRRIDRFLEGRRLRLHPRKTWIAPTAEPTEFLGYGLAPRRRRRLPDDNVARFRGRLRALKDKVRADALDEADAIARIQSWEAHAAFAQTRKLRNAVLGLKGADGKRKPW